MSTKSTPSCPNCRVSIGSRDERIFKFCPFCGCHLGKRESENGKSSSASLPAHTQEAVTLIQGLSPEGENIQYSIGPYQVLRNIGKGGMGEVYLAYDTTCGRRIALKRIREDLVEHPQIHNRFLKEARVTSQLTHPSIIPIYGIHTQEDSIFYTMPFVQGDTLKQILREARQQEKKGEKPGHLGSSIPALTRIFLSICQAIAYAHAKGVLHRDIKPENIIVGHYGEVLLLDWGLAKLIHSTLDDLEGDTLKKEPNPLHQLTHIGRVVGTVAYMAPERALGQPATYRTDIYSLGVILYQILTLRSPFKRGTLKQFREKMSEEALQPPEEIAPYRDVPRSLSRVVMRCLAKDPEQRYASVDALIHDIENFLEGRSEWFEIAHLDIHRKSDWEFQENVLIAEHIAITRSPEISDWVSLMISKASFTENTKIEAVVQIGEKGNGLGFLLSIPEATERANLNDGYCLWLGSDSNKATKLLRSTVEVIHSPEIFLQRHERYKIRIEKIEHNIHFYLNDTLQFSYISHLPLVGTHIGVLSRDADFQLTDFKIYIGSQNITVNCLAVPDAFLAHKNYHAALSEYRRIGYSFPGRAEGREAMFRAGITLLDQAQQTEDPLEKEKLYDSSLREFEKLHGTPGAPLQYLGKALVYRSQKDIDEEVKCFELAFRRYAHHPLLPVLHEQVIYRMHESSRLNRSATYNFVLLALRHIPQIVELPHVLKLISSLQKHWEPLYFLRQSIDMGAKEANLQFAIHLCFWLGKPFIVAEIIDEIIKSDNPQKDLLCDAFFVLIQLGSWGLAKSKMEEIFQDASKSNLNPHDLSFDLVRTAILANSACTEQALKICSFQSQGDIIAFEQERLILYLMEKSLSEGKPNSVHILAKTIQQKNPSDAAKSCAEYFDVWAHLLEFNWKNAEEVFNRHPIEHLSQESSLLHFLYGCWLYATEGKDIAMIHFYGVYEVTYPRSWALFSHYISGKIAEGQPWFQRAFLWEKRQLYKQLNLFYQCLGDQQKALRYKELENKEVVIAS